MRRVPKVKILMVIGGMLMSPWVSLLDPSSQTHLAGYAIPQPEHDPSSSDLQIQDPQTQDHQVYDPSTPDSVTSDAPPPDPATPDHQTQDGRSQGSISPDVSSQDPSTQDFLSLDPIDQKDLSDETAQIYDDLAQAVAAEDWDYAIQLVDQLIPQEPNHFDDLIRYRSHLNGLRDHARSLQRQPLVLLPQSLPILQKPFIGEFLMTNGFDHDRPQPNLDQNLHVLLTTGQKQIPGMDQPCARSDGHAGYDWAMPIGTPILAAASGRVTVARLEPEVYCPLLDRPTQGLRIRIRHEWGSQQLETIYTHLSQILVQEGMEVDAGVVIGRSGNSGCSTGSHLHFEVRRLHHTNGGDPAPVDPYGWLGYGPDPWALHPRGAESIPLWQPGQAPSLGICF